jgi:hypothetical protein
METVLAVYWWTVQRNMIGNQVKYWRTVQRNIIGNQESCDRLDTGGWRVQ